MKRKLYEIIVVSGTNNKASHLYDCIMMLVIIISLIPLAFKSTNIAFLVIDYIATFVFIIDYIIRWITANYKFNTNNPLCYVVYPFTPMAVVDLIVILSSFSLFSAGFKILKILRLMRTFRVLRALKFLRYSKSLAIIINVIKKEKNSLSAVATLAIAYVLLSALVIFNVEPDSFDTFFDAVYWATVSLTTVGYGDIYPTSVLGRIVTMISSVLGIAIIALPSGIITGGYLNEVNSEKIDSK